MKCSSPASSVTEPTWAVFMIQVAPPAPPPVLYRLPFAPGAVVIGDTSCSGKVLEAYQNKADVETTLALLHKW